MTEIFICALSTQHAELNDEDLQYYRNTKNKQISQVRQCLDFLCVFSSLSKKQKMQANLQTIWKSMTILSRILGYEADFCKINKLNIPEGLFILQLLFCNNLFSKKVCRPRQLITHWQSENDQYVVLLSGVVERQVKRTSILQSPFENFSKTEVGRFRKNMRRRFTRTQSQIPICLNSKRSEVRVGEICSGNFRSVTCSQVFKVNLLFWKKYIQKFKQIQEDYIMSFIRKNLSINLNFQLHNRKYLACNHTETKQKDELKPSNLYLIEKFDKKTVVELTNRYIYILYLGQMLVQSVNYKIQISKGCILNPSIFEQLRIQSEQLHLGTALAKTECIVVKIKMDLLNSFLQIEENDLVTLTNYLQELEDKRRNNRQDDTGLKYYNLCSLNRVKIKREKRSTLSPMSLSEKQNIKDMLLNIKNTKLVPNAKNLLQKPSKNQSQSKQTPLARNILEQKQIQNRISKQQKVVGLRQLYYSKKKMKTEVTHPLEKEQLSTKCPLHEKYSIYNQAIFRNCMSRIENHNKRLALAVKETRRKKAHQLSTQQQIVPITQKRINSKDISIKLIKQKMKEIYNRTSQNEELFPYISQKIDNNQEQIQSLNFGKVSSMAQNLYACEVFDQPTKRGIMKKVKRGQLRRVKAN